MQAADFVQAVHAAQVAVAGMAVRALLSAGREHDPEVHSLRLSVTPDAIPGLDCIEVELVNRNGQPVGGYIL